jgi:predicted transcriptional regulator
MLKEKDIMSKRIGATGRAEIARTQMQLIFSDENHPMYFAKDIEYARRYDVTRITIYKIRDSFGVPPRSERLIQKLKKIDLSQYTIKELSKMLNIKYQNLYKILQENGLKIKNDTPPINFLKKYQAERKSAKLSKITEKNKPKK